MKRKIIFLVTVLISFLSFSLISFASGGYDEGDKEFYLFKSISGWLDHGYGYNISDVPAGTYHFDKIYIYTGFQTYQDETYSVDFDGREVWSKRLRKDTDLDDYFSINKTITISGTDTKRVLLDFDGNVGSYLRVKLHYNSFKPNIPENNAPRVYITAPSDTDYDKNSKPSIRYTVFDSDGDSINAKTYLDGKLISYEGNLKNNYSRTITIPDSNWKNLPANILSVIKVEIDDVTGYENSKSDSDTHLIRKVDQPPTISYIGEDGMIKTTLNEPSFKVLVNDPENETLIVNMIHQGNIIDSVNAVSGETVLFNDPDWINRPFDSNIFYQFSVQDANNTVTSNSIHTIKENSNFNFELHEPTINQNIISEYLKLTWLIEDVDNDNFNLKIYSPDLDYDNGVLFDGNIGTDYISSKELFKYLKSGENILNIDISDGFHIQTFSTKINVQDLIDLNIDDNPTFYLPIFYNDKSNVYRNKLENELESDNNIFMLELLPN